MTTSTSTHQALLIIPARMGATRLPRKPLADIAGKPMVVHVLQRAIAANCGPVVVATDHEDIKAVVEAAGGRAVMTNPDHPSGSDRVFEAANLADPTGIYDRVVNIQGDLPFIAPKTIAASVALLDDAQVDIGTAGCAMDDDEAKQSPHVVKIAGVMLDDHRMKAHYFSRAPIPHGDGHHIHHIGLYVFRRAALAKFVSSPPSPIEVSERLEQLRALDMGMRIDVALVDQIPHSVDTAEDLEKVRAVASIQERVG